MGGSLFVTLFLSSYVNKIDKKGRVSVPAGFRAALSGQSFQGIVVFRSSHYAALEGFSWAFMEEMAARMDHFDLFSNAQDDMATAVFGDSVQLPFDGDGRIVLPEGLLKFAGLNDEACFVGLGRKFQIWSPAEFEKRREQARKGAKSLTLPKGGAA
jgi:MraZ protein